MSESVDLSILLLEQKAKTAKLEARINLLEGGHFTWKDRADELKRILNQSIDKLDAAEAALAAYRAKVADPKPKPSSKQVHRLIQDIAAPVTRVTDDDKPGPPAT